MQVKEVADRRMAEEHSPRPPRPHPCDPIKEAAMMSESNKALTDHQPEADGRPNEIPPMDWRRSSMGVGMFVMVCALFAMASGNHVASFLGRLLLVVALLLIAIPMAINIFNSASSTIKRLRGMTTKPGA
jgi:hypothetical protein